MTFLNPLLLVGLVAMAVPVIIHLLHRSSHRVVRWGATHLLRETVSRKSRRIRLEQLILVLVRMAILGVLACCMARPVLSVWSTAAGWLGGEVQVVLILDTSYSMGHGDVFDEARSVTSDLLESLEPGDTVSVVLAGGAPRVLTEVTVQSTADLDAVSERLDTVRPVHGSARLGSALEVAATILSDSVAAGREVYVVTDFQRQNFEENERTRLDTVLRRLNAARPLPSVTWVDVGDEGSANVSVDAVEIEPPSVTVGTAFAVKTWLTLRGAAVRREVEVTLAIDGKDFGSETANLTGGSRQEVRFQGPRHQLEQHTREVGSRRIEVRVSPDSLPGDDRFYRSLAVVDAVPVLVVEGQPQAALLDSGSGFLRLALAPSGDGARDPTGERRVAVGAFQVDLCAPGELADLKLEGRAVVILVNVPELSATAVESLDRFIRRGGAALFFAGDQVRADEYTRDLYRGGEGMLPAEVTSIRSVGPGERVDLELEAPDHPAVAALAAAADDLGLLRIHRWLRVETGRRPPTPRESVVLARLSSGDPLLVEKRHGAGRVVLCATAADDSWSNFPMRSVYVPFLHELVGYLCTSGKAEARNLVSGETIVHRLDSVRNEDGAVVVRRPDGAEEAGEPFEREGYLRFEYRGTDVAGFYTILEKDEPPEYFAVNTDRRESNLDRVDAETLEPLLERHAVDVARGRAAFAANLERRRHGLALFRPLLVLALALVLLEIYLVQRFER